MIQHNGYRFTEGELAYDKAPWWWAQGRKSAWAELKERRQPRKVAASPALAAPYGKPESQITPGGDPYLLLHPANPLSPIWNGGSRSEGRHDFTACGSSSTSSSGADSGGSCGGSE